MARASSVRERARTMPATARGQRTRQALLANLRPRVADRLRRHD